jgi:hypothetical protein
MVVAIAILLLIFAVGSVVTANRLLACLLLPLSCLDCSTFTGFCQGVKAGK